MVEKATDVAALTKLFSPSNASDAPRKRTTEAPRKNPLARPNRVLFSVIFRSFPAGIEHRVLDFSAPWIDVPNFLHFITYMVVFVQELCGW